MDPAEALEFSRYAARLRAGRPELVTEILEALDHPATWTEEELDAAVRDVDEAGLAAALRRLRQRVFLATLLRDLTRRAELPEVCATTTRLAEVAIKAAVDLHHRRLASAHGEPIGAESASAQGLIVVGMGKLGGAELNVSSDIDLVFVYPEDGTTAGPKSVANQEFFDRLGRRVIAALADVTADGFVFRVDMRLRPYGESGPLSSSFAALEQYLITQGRTWERYAWLKARPLTGERCAELERLIEPFVFRKYLDFDAYAGLRDVHHQIREQGRRKDYARNIKLGPGGIREIEFIVQALQLVRGGREPGLRVRGTLPALAALDTRGLLPRPAIAELSAAYVFLRNLEHRLQYRDDRQTHDVPIEDAERAALANACGVDAAAFTALLDRHRRAVEMHFDAVFGEDESNAADPLASIWLDPVPGDTQCAALAAAGYGSPVALIESLARLRQSARYLQLPTLSRQRFGALVPQLLRAASSAAAESTVDPAVVFSRVLTLLETISGRSVYLALLYEHPPVLPRLAQLMEASAWAADYLTRHPLLLDELLDSRVLLAKPDWDAWRSELALQLDAHRGDPERQMDTLRHFQQAQTFRLLAQDLNDLLTVERLADHLSALADIVLAATLECCWAQMHGETKVSPPKFAIIGYGKLGGKELGYASDLDLVFVYDDPSENAPEHYARLAHRLTTWLTSTTAAGRLYDTDLRLRPDGASGLVVSSLAAFSRYQREDAWTWEHQALTRARFVAGDGVIGAAFEAERESILRSPREPQKLRDDIVEMRRRMHAGHPNKTALFDLKHDAGGMVDVEFAVQFLVLLHSAAHPALTRNVGNIALLALAADLALVPAALAASVADAYREYRRLQHQVRLQGASVARVTRAAHAARRAAIGELWTHVFGAPWQLERAGLPADFG
jgi:[glutamine synthetase] adenylyltransferase / [glutamine synthetase]-adenylyl-L-tyrosine phosphorylase